VNKYHLSEEQLATLANARTLAREKIAPRARDVNESDEFPQAIFVELGELGYISAPFSPEFGGSSCDAVNVCVILEEISYASGAVGSSYNAPTSLASSVIANQGSAEQKRRYLSALTSGRTIGAFGLSEPFGGSNAGDPKTRAAKKGGSYLISGSEAFNTSGWIADIFVITARTEQGGPLSYLSAG
jgi:hypothetical protein